MKKGMILNISRQTATVFTDDCRVIKVRHRPDMVRGQEYDLDRMSLAPARTVGFRRLAPALVAACLVLLLVGGVLFSGVLADPVYAVLSIDVNPSLELSLNRDLNVIKVRAINEDAQRLLNSHDFTGLSWQEALRQWTKILQAQNTIQVENMLISAILPDSATMLKEQLVNMEQTSNNGEFDHIQIRVIYSSDNAVATQAAQNGLSVGRQMLLNQSDAQGQNYNANSIAQARLGELVGQLLQNGDHDQTRMTIRETQSLSDATGATETNRETNRETNQETQGSQQGSQGSSQETKGSQQGSMVTNRETLQSETCESSCEPSGSQRMTQATSQETIRETLQSETCESTCEPSGSQSGGPGGH